MPTGSKRAPSAPRDPADDCETPDDAYAHIAPLMRKLAQRLGKPPGALRIWDPYYCAGGVKARLDALGFGDVVNDPDVDFYDVVDGSRPPPPHDICVTNPPFSGNHARRLFEYLNSRGEAARERNEALRRVGAGVRAIGMRGSRRRGGCFSWCRRAGTVRRRAAAGGRTRRWRQALAPRALVSEG